MKTLLILAESIGVDESIDSKIIEIVREFSDGNEIHTYSKEFTLGESGEYLRMKGVKIHTQAITLVATMPEEYDAVIAFDEWAVKNVAQFKTEKKIRASEKSDLLSISDTINVQTKKPEIKVADTEIKVKSKTVARKAPIKKKK